MNCAFSRKSYQCACDGARLRYIASRPIRVSGILGGTQPSIPAHHHSRPSFSFANAGKQNCRSIPRSPKPEALSKLQTLLLKRGRGQCHTLSMSPSPSLTSLHHATPQHTKSRTPHVKVLKPQASRILSPKRSNLSNPKVNAHESLRSHCRSGCASCRSCWNSCCCSDCAFAIFSIQA